MSQNVVQFHFISDLFLFLTNTSHSAIAKMKVVKFIGGQIVVIYCNAHS